MSDGEVRHQQWVHSCLDSSLRTVKSRFQLKQVRLPMLEEAMRS